MNNFYVYPLIREDEPKAMVWICNPPNGKIMDNPCHLYDEYRSFVKELIQTFWTKGKLAIFCPLEGFFFRSITGLWKVKALSVDSGPEEI